MKNRIIGILLCFILALSVCLAPVNTEAAPTYSVYNTFKFAEEYVYQHSEWWCAEYVSRCMRAGGVNIGVITTVTSIREKLPALTGLQFVDAKMSSSGYLTKELNGNNVQPGDIVIQYCYDHNRAPHILIFTGYNSSGIGCFYAHNGALNREAYNFIPGPKYDYSGHNPNCNMGPKVLKLSKLDPNPTVPAQTVFSKPSTPSTPATVSASFSFPTETEYANKFNIEEKNAVLVNQVTKTSGAKVSQVGLYLYDENGNLIKKHTENISNVSAAQTKFHVWYDINKELGITLTQGTTYQYKFFGVFNGKEIAASQMSDFTTNGPTPTPTPTQPSEPSSGDVIYVQYVAGMNGTNVWNGKCTVGEPIGSFPAPTVPEGYTFKGWYTAATGGTQVDENTIYDGKCTKFYAHFEKELTVTVTFDANGGVCETDSMVIPAQCNMPEVPEPVRAGYEFLGWYTKLEDGVQLKKGTKVNVTRDFKVFALWEKLEEEFERVTLIHVYLEPNGGYCDIDEVLVEKGEKIDFLPTPERNGYKFLGWYTDENYGNKKVGVGTTINVSNSLTLTAKWEATAYEFPFADVPSSQWYHKDVKNAHRMGLINGKSATKYAPDDYMTYAEAIKLAACMHQMYHEGEVTLTNGSGENWYQPYVDYAKENGIPYSVSDYNAHVNRRSYVYIFYYALPKTDYAQLNNVNSIPDVAVGDKFADEIYAFYRAGIITGSDGYGTFNPTYKIQRSEVAAILSRMMDKSARKEFTLK